MTIWKYELATTETQRLEMPKGARILTVQVQGGKPCLWAIVNPENKPEVRVIEIYGIGNDLHSEGRQYIGTFQLYEGTLVFHVFEYRTRE